MGFWDTVSDAQSTPDDAERKRLIDKAAEELKEEEDKEQKK